MPDRKRCFVCMPFAKELHYFYLYLRQHLTGMGIEVSRGDGQVMTSPLYEKLSEMVRSADMIIADITGNNPNVMFELGLCFAQGKSVILITQDNADAVPTDLRHLEFIRYDLSRDEELFGRLANAINNIFVERYNQLFAAAQNVLGRFKADTGMVVAPIGRDGFIERLRYAEAIGEIAEVGLALDSFLLPRIIQDVTDLTVMRAITDWVDQQT